MAVLAVLLDEFLKAADAEKMAANNQKRHAGLFLPFFFSLAPPTFPLTHILAPLLVPRSDSLSPCKRTHLLAAA